MKKRKLFPKNSFNNSKIRTVYKFKSLKDCKKKNPFINCHEHQSPWCFGWIKLIVDDMVKRPTLLYGELVFDCCRGKKMPCVVFDDHAFCNPTLTWTETYEKDSRWHPDNLKKWVEFIKDNNKALASEWDIADIPKFMKEKYASMTKTDKPHFNFIITTPGNDTKYTHLFEAMKKYNEEHGVTLSTDFGKCTKDSPFYVRRGMKNPTTEKMDWSDIVLMKPEDIKKKYNYKIPLKEGRMFPVDIEYTYDELRRELTPEELENGIKINYTFMPGNGNPVKSDDIIMKFRKPNIEKDNISFEDQCEQWRKDIANACMVPYNMLFGNLYSNDIYKYAFISKIFPSFGICVGKEGQHIGRVKHEIKRFVDLAMNNNDLCMRSKVFKFYSEFIKWIDKTYENMELMPLNIKYLRWLLYCKRYQLKIELNSVYGYPGMSIRDVESNKIFFPDSWHIDCRKGNIKEFRNITDTARSFMDNFKHMQQPPYNQFVEYMGEDVVHIDTGHFKISNINGIPMVSMDYNYKLEDKEGLVEGKPIESIKDIHLQFGLNYSAVMTEFDKAVSDPKFMEDVRQIVRETPLSGKPLDLGDIKIGGIIESLTISRGDETIDYGTHITEFNEKMSFKQFIKNGEQMFQKFINSKGGTPMSEQKTDSVINIPLPDNHIYELLGQEEIDHENGEVIRDVRGKIIDYKWRVKLINYQNAKGVLIAWPDEKKKVIFVGMSCCDADEQFEFGKKVMQAMQNAYDRDYEFPEDYNQHLNTFLSRCRVEYPQLEEADWGLYFYDRKTGGK